MLTTRLKKLLNDMFGPAYTGFPVYASDVINGRLLPPASLSGHIQPEHDHHLCGNRQVLIGDTIPYHSLLHLPAYYIDDRQPPFEYAKGKRMWFYNGIDLGSEAFTTWVYGKTKEGIIMEFYRQMVRNYEEWGFKLPYELECESSLNSSFADTFLREGYMFEAVRIEANNARGKCIEAPALRA